MTCERPLHPGPAEEIPRERLQHVLAFTAAAVLTVARLLNFEHAPVRHRQGTTRSEGQV